MCISYRPAGPRVGRLTSHMDLPSLPVSLRNCLMASARSCPVLIDVRADHGPALPVPDTVWLLTNAPYSLVTQSSDAGLT